MDENDPDRTKELRIHGFPTRNLGNVQMTTDTAINTSYIILEEGTPFEKIQFIDRPTFQFSKYESLTMPFRYLSRKNEQKPLMPEGMLELLREDSFL